MAFAAKISAAIWQKPNQPPTTQKGSFCKAKAMTIIMNDKQIVEMLFSRSEAALSTVQNKYGKYCHQVAYNILGNNSDAEECVNDTYLKVWQSIPPNRPDNLLAYIARIARNLSLDRLRKNSAQKHSSATVILEEVSDIVSDGDRDFSDDLLARIAINSFLENLPARDRKIFVQRYWYSYSSKDIAEGIGKDEYYVNVKLARLRAKLKIHLEKEGIEL